MVTDAIGGGEWRQAAAVSKKMAAPACFDRRHGLVRWIDMRYLRLS
jgi:hypothetical protein